MRVFLKDGCRFSSVLSYQVGPTVRLLNMSLFGLMGFRESRKHETGRRVIFYTENKNDWITL